MDLFYRFKKDYFNYLLSVILPAIIMALSIPVLKHLLGAGGYGNFSIWFNAVLLCTASLTGWITQSILRFSSVHINKPLFARQAIAVSLTTQAIIFLPVFLIIWYLGNDMLLGILFATALFATSLLFSISAISQAGFLSKKNIYSETIRVFSYIACALFFLLLTDVYYLYALFIAVTISYLMAALYLHKQVRTSLSTEQQNGTKPEKAARLAKQFFKYGAPLSVWFVFSYLASYIDKLFMNKNLGAEIQGNYQAIFDLLARSLVVLVAPVTTSLFPLLTQSYKKGEIATIKKILKKIILIEAASFVIVSILYWWFGAGILLNVLKTPHTYSYKLAGFMVIAGTFVWLIASVAHKGFELRMQSIFLLGMIGIAFFTQVILYLIFYKIGNMLLYPLGYLLSGVVYLLLVSFSEIYRSSKSLQTG